MGQDMTTETTVQSALLEDLTSDVAVELTKKGGILFSPIEKICMTRNIKPGLTRIWDNKSRTQSRE